LSLTQRYAKLLKAEHTRPNRSSPITLIIPLIREVVLKPHRDLCGHRARLLPIFKPDTETAAFESIHMIESTSIYVHGFAFSLKIEEGRQHEPSTDEHLLPAAVASYREQIVPNRQRPPRFYSEQLCIIIATGAILPFTTVGATIGLVRFPLSYFFWLIAILFCYCLLAQAVKIWFLKRFNAWI